MKPGVKWGVLLQLNEVGVQIEHTVLTQGYQIHDTYRLLGTQVASQVVNSTPCHCHATILVVPVLYSIRILLLLSVLLRCLCWSCWWFSQRVFLFFCVVSAFTLLCLSSLTCVASMSLCTFFFCVSCFPAHPLANTVRIRICMWLNQSLKFMRKGQRCLDKPLVDDEMTSKVFKWMMQIISVLFMSFIQKWCIGFLFEHLEFCFGWKIKHNSIIDWIHAIIICRRLHSVPLTQYDVRSDVP